MPVLALAPEASTAPLLAGADFADAYRIDVEAPPLDAADAARRVFSRTPRWVGALLGLRDRLAGLFGLRRTDEARPDAGPRIGFFPVVSQTPDRVVMGFDDWHLDFRVVVDLRALGDARRQVTATTLVRTHNRAGRAYLALIMPFHRAIVRAMLAQAARD
jgi:hypothetical protein